MDLSTKDLIRRDMLGELSESERDSLLSAMMDDPQIEAEMRRQEANLVAGVTAREAPSTTPWMALAASMLLGVALTATYMQQIQPSQEGVTTSNVYYLDNVRSETPEYPIVQIEGGDGYVGLVAYPSYQGYERLRVAIEKRTPTEEWDSIYGVEISSGNRDSVVLQVREALLSEGIHRLRTTGLTPAGDFIPDTEVVFQVKSAQ